MLASVTKMKQEKRRQKKKKTQPTAKPDEKKRKNEDKSAPSKPLKKKKPQAAKSYKFHIYPKPTQHIKLKQWLSIIRWTYNSCVAYINQWKPYLA